jgi:hypothetical protein
MLEHIVALRTAVGPSLASEHFTKTGVNFSSVTLSIKNFNGMTGAACICNAVARGYYICTSKYILTAKYEGIRHLVRRGIGCKDNIETNNKKYDVNMWTSYLSR